MTTQIQKRDWEALSAYLDDQLAPKDRSTLQSRLEAEPGLQTALKELRRTRLILKQAPHYRAPRNFTLTSVMTGEKRSSHAASSAYPVLRLASALAMAFFAMVTAGSFAIQFISPAQSVVMQDQSQLARPGGPFGMGGGGGVSEAPDLAALPTHEEMAPEAELVMESPAAKSLAVTPLPTGTLSPTPEQMLAMAAPQESSVADDASLPAGVQQEAPAAPIVDQPAAQKAWSFLGILQIALAILALVTGLAALYLRRSSFR